ncbi:threonylcarbamoyl-AMP synthase [Candidatus Pacearchaeota archaeon]|nr:threonylcarbamoyl-AMP synthase [Candidatus Pacearchaeota archaeon]|tara:strand:- start:11701 stop:12225 length:525 start_codon:yes stop_codon:yes gene_type:complete
MKESKMTKEILAGKIFIYPTDTIYGIGCNALDEKAVIKIKEIKGRDKGNPLSVIAPSKGWIKENCIEEAEELIEKYLPGPYTLILKKKNPKFLSWCSETDLLGVRIPKNDFTNQIQKSGVPFITTSVNTSGESPVKEISQIKEEIIRNVDHVIDHGRLDNPPSTLIVGGKEIKR